MIAVLGIDPGVNGGIALLDPHGSPAWIRAFHPDMTREEVVKIIEIAANLLKTYGSRICMFEKVQHMTGDGGKGSHTFGYIKGLLQGAVLAYGLDLRDVSPMTWQCRLECLSGGNKNVTKTQAIARFPAFKKSITHNTADALLIAKYGQLCSV